MLFKERHDCVTGSKEQATTCASAGLVDPNRVAVMGGSHGGFLTGHLVGQHAERFRTGVLQNPVMDLSGFIHDTDIPDWCYIEAFGVEVGACIRSSLRAGARLIYVLIEACARRRADGAWPHGRRRTICHAFAACHQ